MSAVGWCDCCGRDGDLYAADDTWTVLLCRSCLAIHRLTGEQVRAVTDRIVTDRMELREGLA